MKQKIIENHTRSLVKAISWRITGTLDTVLWAFIITGKLKWALSIGLVELVSKIFLYYFHEQLWNKISFGKKNVPQDDFNI